MAAHNPIKLKRCPFCPDGIARIEIEDRRFYGYDHNNYSIVCDNCGVRITSSNVRTAADRWNTRTTGEAEDVFVEVYGTWIRKVKQ